MLSYRFYYYYFGVIGQRTGRQLLLKKAFILTDPKRRGHAWGDTEFSQEAAESGKPHQETLLWFLGEGTGKAGSTGLGLASLNHLSGLWGRGIVPGCLISGPGVI